MIKLISQGNYQLLETSHDTKILKLDNHTYAWPYAKPIGEILVLSYLQYNPITTHRITRGLYRIYSVKNEPRLTDLKHLELSVGVGLWQGYLLPTGLPHKKKQRSRIIPTQEIITNKYYDYELATA